MTALAKSTAGSGAGSAGAGMVKKKKRIKQKAMKNMLSPAQVEQLVNASGASGAGAGMAKKKKRIKPVLVSPLAGAGAGAPASASGGTVGQKNFAKKMSKMKKAYQKLGGKDANKDLAF